MHNITENSKHIVIPVMLVMHSSIQNVDEATDGLNENLREWVANNFLADYKFNLGAVRHVMSDAEPEEGDLFVAPSAINTNLYPNSVGGETKFVWVSACDSMKSVSFDWGYDESIARKQFEANKALAMKFGNSQSYLFVFEVSASLSQEEITKEVEDFCYSEPRSKRFNESELVQCFPFTPDAWQYVIDNYKD